MIFFTEEYGAWMILVPQWAKSLSWWRTGFMAPRRSTLSVTLRTLGWSETIEAYLRNECPHPSWWPFGSFHRGYPNSWMACNGQSLYKWMICTGYPHRLEHISPWTFMMVTVNRSLEGESLKNGHKWLKSALGFINPFFLLLYMPIGFII